jgi:hypothetical protein
MEKSSFSIWGAKKPGQGNRGGFIQNTNDMIMDTEQAERKPQQWRNTRKQDTTIQPQSHTPGMGNISIHGNKSGAYQQMRTYVMDNREKIFPTKSQIMDSMPNNIEQSIQGPWTKKSHKQGHRVL